MANTQTFVADVNLNARPAINNLDLLDKHIKQLQKTARQRKKGGDALGLKETEEEIERVKTVISSTRKEIQSVDRGFQTSGKSVKGLENALKLATLQWERLSDPKDRAKMAAKIRSIKTELQKMNSELDVTQKKSGSAFGRLFQRAAEYTSFYMIFNRSQALIKNAIQGNLQLADSISDIQKVSGLTENQVKGLVSQIEKIDSRNSAEALNRMAYAAGKLGIKGTENLLGFTRAADKLNVALKEYLGDGEEGIVRLMKFANVMGTTKQFGVEQALLKTGSALNYMTQSTAAAADYMIDFAGRFGPIARQAKMTSGDVIGLASALDALTVNNEEAATSMQKFVIRLLSAPTHVARALGMNAETSKQMVETGQSIELVEMALSKLGERAEKYGVSGIQSVIGEIGSKGQAQRLIKTLATLSNNTQMVHDYVVMANDAFNEGTSVLNEYNIKNENAAAIMERTKNSWQKVLVNAENVGVIKDLAQSFYEFSMELQRDEVWMGSIKVAFQGVIGAIELLIKLLPSLITLLIGVGATKLIAWLGTAYSAFIEFSQAVRAGTVSMQLFNKAAKTNWVGLLLSLIPAAIVAIQTFSEKTKSATSAVTKLNESVKEYNRTSQQSVNEATILFERLKQTNVGTEERRKLVKKINDMYGSYLSNQITERDNLDKIASAQEEVNKKLRQSLALRAQRNAIEQVTEPDIKRQTDAQMRAKEIFDAEGYANAYDVAMQDIVKTTAVLLDNGEKYKEIIDTIWDKYFKVAPEGATPNPYQRLTQDLVRNFRSGNSVADLRNAISEYIAGAYNEQLHIKQIRDKYKNLIGDYEEPDNGLDTTTTVLEDFSSEEKAKANEELKDAKDRVSAIKSILESFYKYRQEAIENAYKNEQITIKQRDQLLTETLVQQSEAIIKAWKYMLGDQGAKQVWEEQLKLMETQIYDSSYDMSVALSEIAERDLNGVGAILSRIGYKITDGMRKTIAEQERLIAESASKITLAIRKELEKYDYVQGVRTQFMAALQQLGIFSTRFDDGLRGTFITAEQTTIDGMRHLIERLKGRNLDMTALDGQSDFWEAMRDTSELSTDMLSMSPEQMQEFYKSMQSWGDHLILLAQDVRGRFAKAIQDIGLGDVYTDEMQKLFSFANKVKNLDLGSDIGTFAFQSLLVNSDTDIGKAAVGLTTEQLITLRDAIVQYQKELEESEDAFYTSEANVLRENNLFRTKFDEGVRGVFNSATEVANEAVKELNDMYEQLFYINIKTPEGLLKFREMLSETHYLSEDVVNADEEQLEYLYYKTMELGDKTVEAAEKARKEQKRIIDTRWTRTTRYADNEKAIAAQEGTNKSTSSITGKWGIESSFETSDSEVQLYAMRLQAATDYYTYLKLQHADERTLQEQEQEIMKNTVALQEKLAAKMNDLQTFFKDAMNTLPDYGTALGEAFSQANPEERAEAFKTAHKEILKSLGDATKKMIIEWVKQRIQHSIQQHLMMSEEKSADVQRLSHTLTAETAIAQAKQTIGQTILATQQAQSAESLTTEATETTGRVNLGIAGAAAKTLSQLGWWGVPLVAVITALLNGLLSWALGSIFKSSDTSSTTEATSKLRLAPGMLTYDSGNVQTFSQASEGKRYTVVGNDGNVYQAKKQSKLQTGILTSPIATMIAGHPALVAERGPEMIIGRETLRNMTQFRPDLLQQIINFDRNRQRFRAYDSGNISDLSSAIGVDGGASNTEFLHQVQATMQSTQEALTLLTRELQKGIKAGINKYELIEETAEGFYTTKKKRTNMYINRLFKG
ncbi:MAG: phage tail tape measure protein [Bacteroidaceae bacterium]|nr:phage tail tape measure protein [Bacteroidaceae bacterium]